MLKFRFASKKDVDLYYNWVNDPDVRINSLNNEPIKLEDHVSWFFEKLKDPNVFLYIFFDNKNEPVGQVRIEKKSDWIIVGQSIDQKYRGRKYGSEMLFSATEDFLKRHAKETIVSVVKKENIASLKMAKRSGFFLIPDKNESLFLVLKGRNFNNKSFIEKVAKFYNLEL